MQRKKKVETYDGEIDYFAPAIAQPPPPQPSYAASHVDNGPGYVHAAAASPQAAANGDGVPSLQELNPRSHQVEQQPAQPVTMGYQSIASPPRQSSEPMAPSYNTWEAEQQPHAGSEFRFNEYGIGMPSSITNEYDQQQLSPIAVPVSLRPISKGIKRSPSAGIISALAAAESMARAGSSTNASASPAPSVNGERMSSGGLPPLSSIGCIGGGSGSALPTLPVGIATSVADPGMTATPVVEETESEYIATSFAVCNAPIFSSEGGPSEFDAIADSADALDSFNLDDTHAPGEFDAAALATAGSGGSAWLAPAQSWQSPRVPAAQHQERPPSAPVATQKVESASVDSRAPVAHEYQYKFAASPSPSPVPTQQIAQYQQQQAADDDDFFAHIGDDGKEVKERGGSDFMLPSGTEYPGPYVPAVEASFLSEQQQLEDQKDVSSEPHVPVTAEQEVEEVVDEPQPEVPQQKQQEQVLPGPELAPVTTEHTPGSTWYDDAGYCYYLSEDGWKYFWDNSSQQWQAHEYLGTGVDHADTDTSGTKGTDGQTEATTIVDQQHQEDVEEVANTETELEVASAPTPEASFSDIAAGRAPVPVAVAEEHSVAAATATAAESNYWATSGQESQTGTQYSSYYEQQQHTSFLSEQQQQAGVTDAHTTPSTAPIPATFVPSMNARHLDEFMAMHPSPYMQPSIATTVPPTWGAATTAASPPQQVQPQQHQQHYHQPQHYHHQQKSLHPSCGFAKLTFGGRLVRVSSSGTITTHLLSALPQDVVRPVGAACSHSSIKGRIEMLSSFPGPLGTTLNKEKAAAFFAARKEACVGEEPGSDAAALFTLWSVLEAKALHIPTTKAASTSSQSTAANGGSNGNASGAASNNSGVDAAVAAALRQDAGVAAPITTNTQHSTATPSTAALQSIQDLVLSGRKAEAVQAAVQCHAWPLALILARSLGAVEWQSVVERYAADALSPASPLSTVCMLASGSSARALPDATTNPAAAAQVLDTWRQHAAALAVGHMQGAEQALESLGEALLARGCVSQAHTCFVLAGVPLQPSDSSTSSISNGQEQQHQHHQFAVVGASRTLAPRTYAALPVILRTEMFTWSRTVGNTQAVPNFLWVLPYKLLHAYALAEMGMLSQSAQYCSSILTTLQGNKVPPGLAVCRASAADLNERLQQLAAARKVSLAGAQFNAGAIVSSVGKLLDRGISALMGGERQHSRSSSFTTDIGGGGGGAGTLPGHSRRSSVTTLPSSPLRMPTGATASGAVVHTDNSHLQPPKLLSSFMNRVASFKSIVTPEPTASAVGTSADPSEPENAFYYDNELKIWRERGKPPPSPVEEPPPPPTAASWQTLAPATLGTPPLPSPSGAVNCEHAMPPPVVQHQHHAGVGGVSRYAMAPIGAAVASSPPAQASSLLPQPALSVGATFRPFNPAAGAASGASFNAPTILTPPIGGNQIATAAQHPAQFVPRQQSNLKNSAAGDYGQPAMEQMSEVEL